MELMEIAELQAALEGVSLPAEKPELIEYAAAQAVTPGQLRLLARLPERKFATIDEVAECLLAVQPKYAQEVPHEPREESDLPPGGDDYTNASPVSGAVRERQASS